MEQRRRAGAQACLIERESACTLADILFVDRGPRAKLILLTGRATHCCVPVSCLGTSSEYNCAVYLIVYIWYVLVPFSFSSSRLFGQLSFVPPES